MLLSQFQIVAHPFARGSTPAFASIAKASMLCAGALVRIALNGLPQDRDRRLTFDRGQFPKMRQSRRDKTPSIQVIDRSRFGAYPSAVTSLGSIAAVTLVAFTRR
jgi:hypothetical protein